MRAFSYLSATALLGVLVFAMPAGADSARDYRFDGSISREVLENYLSRAITMLDLLTGAGNPDDNIRMLKETGARFAGRTIYVWGGESQLQARLAKARELVPRIREAVPDLILQAAVFEVITPDVASVQVPEWLFTEFGLPAENRGFLYEAMVFPDGRFRNQWGKDAAVPDITQTETKMWFLYAASQYIDAGCEAIHFGQVALIGASDPAFENWWNVLTRVRRYAKTHARRHMVLCDAHTPDGGPL